MIYSFLLLDLMGKRPVWSVAMVLLIGEIDLLSQIATKTRWVRSDGESGKVKFSSSVNASRSACRLSRGLVDKSCDFEVDLEPWHYWSRWSMVLATDEIKYFSTFFVVKFENVEKWSALIAFKYRFDGAKTCSVNVIYLFWY